MAKFDVLILGGGVMGMSTACHLAMRGAAKNLRVAVVERDASYRQASALLSAGGMRQQFSLEQNVKMSMYGLEFLRHMHSWPSSDNVQFQQQGYVFLANTDSAVKVLRENHGVQTSAGADISLLLPSQLKMQYPWMKTEDLQLASFGRSGEGWFDPWTLLSNMKRRAVEGGVTIINGCVNGVALAEHGALLHANIGDKNGQEEKISAHTYVMATGAWARESCMDSLLSQLGGLGTFKSWPVRPRKRCVFNFHCPSAVDLGIEGAGLIVDPSGVYFRPEGRKSGKFICGVSPSAVNDEDVCNFDSQDVDHNLYEDIIWPTLAARVPAFEEIKLKASWAGLYEYSTLDQNAFIGRMPSVANLLICNGFSGHGLQQSPAAGRAMAELICDGGYTTLDLSIFGVERLLTNPPTRVLERNIV